MNQLVEIILISLGLNSIVQALINQIPKIKGGE